MAEAPPCRYAPRRAVVIGVFYILMGVWTSPPEWQAVRHRLRHSAVLLGPARAVSISGQDGVGHGLHHASGPGHRSPGLRTVGRQVVDVGASGVGQCLRRLRSAQGNRYSV